MKAAKGIVVSINESNITLLGTDGVFYSVPLPEHVPLLGDELFISEAQLVSKQSKSWFTTKRFKSWGIVASIFLLLVSTAIFFPYTAEASYVVALEINPSMELYINKDNKVIKVVAVTDEATSLLESLSLKGKDLAIAVKEITDQAKIEGYLDQAMTENIENTIVATVVSWNHSSDDEQLLVQVEELLKASLSNEEMLVTSTTRQTLEQAHQENMPVFKYQVVQTLESKGVILEQDTIRSLSSEQLMETYQIAPINLIDTKQNKKEQKQEDKRDKSKDKNVGKDKEKDKDKDQNRDKDKDKDKDKNREKDKEKDKDKDVSKENNKNKNKLIHPVFEDVSKEKDSKRKTENNRNGNDAKNKVKDKEKGKDKGKDNNKEKKD